MRTALLALAAAGVLSFTPPAFAQSASSPMTGTPDAMMGGGNMGHGSQRMRESVMGGMQKMQGMQLSGDTDKDFAMMMRMHHQQGLEMAKAQLQHGKDKEMRAMAQKILKQQRKEIAEFDRWLSKHR